MNSCCKANSMFFLFFFWYVSSYGLIFIQSYIFFSEIKFSVKYNNPKNCITAQFSIRNSLIFTFFDKCIVGQVIVFSENLDIHNHWYFFKEKMIIFNFYKNYCLFNILTHSVLFSPANMFNKTDIYYTMCGETPV